MRMCSLHAALGSDRLRRSLHRNRIPRPHLSRRHDPLRHGAAQPRHALGRLGRLRRLPLRRYDDRRLLAYAFERHGVRRSGRYPLLFHAARRRGARRGVSPRALHLFARPRAGRVRLLRRRTARRRAGGRADGGAPHGRAPLRVPRQGAAARGHRPDAHAHRRADRPARTAADGRRRDRGHAPHAGLGGRPVRLLLGTLLGALHRCRAARRPAGRPLLRSGGRDAHRGRGSLGRQRGECP